MVDGSTDAQATSSSVNNGPPKFPNKGFNKQIAVVSTLAAVGLFLSARLDFGVSLKDLSAAALPYEEVLLCNVYLFGFHVILLLFYLFRMLLLYIIFSGVSGSFKWEAHCCGILRRLVRSMPGISSRCLQS